MIKGVSERGKNTVNIASVIALHVDVFEPVHSKCPLLMMLMGRLILLSGQLLNDFSYVGASLTFTDLSSIKNLTLLLLYFCFRCFGECGKILT